MLVITAIDLREGKVVRLTKGAFDRETIYSQSPPDVMQKWQREGAKLVHVVDLDGAREGIRRNLGSLKNILAVAKIPVQFGGGLRTFEAVSEVLSSGVWRAVVGTKALDTDLVNKLVKKFKERIAIGIDIRNGLIQTEGWQSSESKYTLETFCQELEKIGVKTIILTDVTRDGTLKGPNVELINNVLKIIKMNLVASGGVSNLSDLKMLNQIKVKNFEGVIVGKALYEQKMTLPQAIKELESKTK